MRQAKQFAGRLNDQNALMIWSVIAVITFQFILGLYAVALNLLFYANYGPFFDSLSYDNLLANMQLNAQRDGTVAALSRAIYSSTVVYPWVLFAPFARFGIASRAVGVWIQIFTAAWMQLAIVFYFVKLRGRTWAESIVFSAAFVLIAAAFDSNGGLSDFRMDLLQYLLFVTVMATYLLARKLQALGWWALLGLTTGLLCLGRATSLVYIVPIFGVCATVDLIVGRQIRRRVMLRWLLASAVAAAVAGWFFISHYGYLYFYYVVWNQDANAHLSLSKSVAHLRLAVNHIGILLLVVLVLIALHTCAQSLRDFRTGAERRLNWRPLLFSVVPLGYLVLSGSGLNPFVSIVGVGGIVLFLLDPLDASQIPLPRPLSALRASVLILALGFNAAGGIAQNSWDVPTWMPRREGIREVMQTMTTNVAAHADRPRRFSYAFDYTAGLNLEVIFNTMFFDQHIRFDKDGAAMIAGSQLVGVRLVPTSVQRLKLEDKEKIADIVQSADERVDFLVTPAAGTELPMSVYENRFSTEINRRLMLSGEWEQIAGPIEISPIEKVIVLHNRKRAADPE